MSIVEILFFGLSVAWCIVEILRIKFRPFNCMMCMTGWCSLGIALINPSWYDLFYLPAGVFIGAMFEGIKMRWL